MGSGALFSFGGEKCCNTTSLDPQHEYLAMTFYLETKFDGANSNIYYINISATFLHLIAKILVEAKPKEDFLLFSSIDDG